MKKTSPTFCLHHIALPLTTVSYFMSFALYYDVVHNFLEISSPSALAYYVKNTLINTSDSCKEIGTEIK